MGEKESDMIRQKADKIMSYTSVSDKEKVDRLLFLNADQYCNLGSESSKTSRMNAESNSRYIYRYIKSLDEDLGKLLLRYREE